jgi:hypothetical protein
MRPTAHHPHKMEKQMLWRVYYENGFWGDEIAPTKEFARYKAEQIALDSGTRVKTIKLRSEV